MTPQELKDKQIELNAGITGLLNLFKEETGFIVTFIDIEEWKSNSHLERHAGFTKAVTKIEL